MSKIEYVHNSGHKFKTSKNLIEDLNKGGNKLIPEINDEDPEDFFENPTGSEADLSPGLPSLNASI